MTRTRSLMIRSLLALAAIALGACASPTAPTPSSLRAPAHQSNSGYVLASCDVDSASTP